MNYREFFTRIILALFILVPWTSSYGQSFKGGVHAGLVGSQVAGDLYSGYNKAGISGGGWVSMEVSPRGELQMELSFLQKGSRENPDYDKGKFDSYLMRLGYVELPFLYRMIYSNKLNFETGLGMNFLLYHFERSMEEELLKEFNNQNLCFILGLSYNINEHLRANFRTNNSILSIRKEKINGDVWRLWGYGQFSDALILSLYYKL